MRHQLGAPRGGAQHVALALEIGEPEAVAGEDPVGERDPGEAFLAARGPARAKGVRPRRRVGPMLLRPKHAAQAAHGSPSSNMPNRRPRQRYVKGDPAGSRPRTTYSVVTHAARVAPCSESDVVRGPGVARSRAFGFTDGAYRVAFAATGAPPGARGLEIGREVRVDLATAGDLNQLRGLPLHEAPPLDDPAAPLPGRRRLGRADHIGRCRSSAQI